MLKRLILFLSHLFEKPFPPGTLVAERYTVVRLLGTGGYGHTYQVIDQETGSQVALKALRLHKRISRSGKAGFEREKEFLQKIQTSGVPAYYDSGKHEGKPYYTMELVEGKNFEQIIFEEGRSFDERQAFEVASEILDILYGLHQQGIIHRDVRIPNVIQSKDRIYLLDLGLAQTAVMAKGHAFFKKYHPRKERNVQADFYGLGHFILFLLYSSYSPAPGQKEQSWAEELDISQQARAIIKRLLKIDGEYSSCSEVQIDISRLINEEEKENVII
ncbi:hypothetical protein AM500_10780 [Bacillus sp. FJAT-18017]|uniref:serine/threonine protein kinase n=1 Tax=Bacillus sp. FJAT-18017 TaxID=1705566 RepID=UPI0006B00F79|nr:protein kinase [Bacillus sp. FJAT-18017]ALC90212.1 hypothetical protein AM500_10780 [Bacillus sp. FJAT-18017]